MFTKRIFRLSALLLIMFLILNTIRVAALEIKDETPEESMTAYSSDGKRSVEYFPSRNLYYLKGVSPELLEDAFTSGSELALKSEKALPDAVVSAFERGIVEERKRELGIGNDRGVEYNTVEKTYYKSTSVIGVYGEVVYIDYVVVMNVTTVTYGGVDYDMFVSIPDNAIAAGLRSGPYTTASGWLDPVLSIVDSGSRLKIRHTIQLEITVATEISLGTNSDWYQVSGTYSYLYYYRNHIHVKTSYIKLPLYNVLY